MISTVTRGSRQRPAAEARSRGLAALLVAGALLTGTLFQAVVATSASAGSAAAATSLPVVTQDVSQLSAFDAELLRLANVKRAEAGLPLLQETRGLDNLSTWWSTQEVNGVTGGTLQHNPNGWTMVTTYGASKRTVWGENVVKWAPATTSAQSIFDAYWSSATHKANLLNKTYRYVGVGTATTAAGVSFNTMNFTDQADAGQTFDPLAAATPTGQYESLTLTGATVKLVGWAVDPDITTTASQIKVKDTAADGTVVNYTTTANVSRTDVGQKFPKSGPSHGFDYSYVTAGRGVHSVCATVVNQGAGLGDVPLGCLSYAVGNPVGLLYSATASGGTLSLAGWAVDPDQPTAAATVTVTDKQPNGTITTTKLLADKVSAAANSAVPGAGDNHAFIGTAAISGIGSHDVCATVAGIRSTAIVTDLGCKTVTIAAAQPVGSFDTLTKQTFNTVTVSGWAVDPDFPTKASTVTVKVTNGAGTTETRNIAADKVLGSDVAGAGKNHGFTATVALTTDGVNTVCISSVSLSDPKTSTDLGCKTMTVNWLTGWLDKVTPATDTKNVRTLKIDGWAADYGNLTATATVRIDITAPDGKVSSTSVQANALRKDVGRAVAGAGDNHGYTATVTVAAAGSYKVCATALSTQNAAVSKQWPCVTVTVT